MKQTPSEFMAQFIVPAFGAAPLRMVFAYGLSLMIGYLTIRPVEDKDDKHKIAEGFAFAIITSLFALLLGWIASQFV